MDEYQALLEKALADEISTVRLYLAAMAKAPPGDVATLLDRPGMWPRCWRSTRTKQTTLRSSPGCCPS